MGPDGKRWSPLIVPLVSVFLAVAGVARAADHDDTPAMKAAPRHEARVTDLHVFTPETAGPGKDPRQESLVISVSTNPAIPTTAATYSFPSDLTLSIFIDRHSRVDFKSDPVATATYGGTIVEPSEIEADIELAITFDAAGMPQLERSGLDEDVTISLFAGLRDDPFIRGPRRGRNVASVVLEMPLKAIRHGKHRHTLLVWAMSSVPGLSGSMTDLGARALRSQFAENMLLNDYVEPADHAAVLGMVPDVVIFDTKHPAAFPNGRELTDDVVDLVGNASVLSTDCPTPMDPAACNPTKNDVPFLTTFPYLAPPQGAAAGNEGVVLHFGGKHDS